MTDEEFESCFTPEELAKMELTFAARRAQRLREKQREAEAKAIMTMAIAKSIMKGRRKYVGEEVDAALDLISSQLGELGVLEHCRFRCGARNHRGRGVWELVVDVGKLEVVRKTVKGTEVAWVGGMIMEVERPFVVAD